MKEYNKLIRDRIPEIIEKTGNEYEVEELDDKRYLESLDKKLQEELEEYLESGEIAELADLVEVIYAILDHKDISRDEFEKIRLDKKEDRGGFAERLFLLRAEARN